MRRVPRAWERICVPAPRAGSRAHTALSLLFPNRLTYATDSRQVTALLSLGKRHVMVGYFIVDLSLLLVEHSLVVLGLTLVSWLDQGNDLRTRRPVHEYVFPVIHRLWSGRISGVTA